MICDLNVGAHDYSNFHIVMVLWLLLFILNYNKHKNRNRVEIETSFCEYANLFVLIISALYFAFILDDPFFIHENYPSISDRKQ